MNHESFSSEQIAGRESEEGIINRGNAWYENRLSTFSTLPAPIAEGTDEARRVLFESVRKDGGIK